MDTLFICLGASGARGLGAICSVSPVPAILSASCLVVSGGLSLDVRLDLFPFDIFIIALNSSAVY